MGEGARVAGWVSEVEEAAAASKLARRGRRAGEVVVAVAAEVAAEVEWRAELLDDRSVAELAPEGEMGMGRWTTDFAPLLLPFTPFTAALLPMSEDPLVGVSPEEGGPPAAAAAAAAAAAETVADAVAAAAAAAESISSASQRSQRIHPRKVARLLQETTATGDTRSWKMPTKQTTKMMTEQTCWTITVESATSGQKSYGFSRGFR